ncbi:MAG: N-6 DNA methylase, partial [Bacteroidia bacterium]|nr:N-6 DNA methylase [Bacteroidia bacterium]
LRNPDIEKKENELKELRHKYFSATTRKEKLQYQKQDKKLREEISILLVNDGWNTTVAKQIVAFDPYDQNTFVNWFDPEWMFGLTPNSNKNNYQSDEITILNKQIESVNKQIQTINLALGANKIDTILKLRFVSAHLQINIIEQELENIKNRITDIVGIIENDVNNVVKEPFDVSYFVNALNKSIKELNKKIDEVSKELKPPRTCNDGVFDVVIGNPPYIAGKSGLLSEQDKKYFNKKYETAEYQLDTYILFTERGINTLKQGGTISYIMPNTWLANIHLTKIRKFLLEKTSINEILLMPDDVFLTSVVDTTIIICKRESKPKNKIKIGSFRDWHHTALYEVEQDFYKQNEKQILDIGISEGSRSLLNKISSGTVPVSEICDVNRGVHAYRKDGYGKSKFGKGYQTERDYNERSYHSLKKIDETYFREVRGKNIFAFRFELSDEYVSWGDWLAEPREWKYFEGERIYLRKIVGKTLYAAFVNNKNVADQSVYIAKVKKGKAITTQYLLALLNSRLLAWYFRVKANEFDDLFPQIKVTEFKELPIKQVDIKLQQSFIALVNKIVTEKKEDNNTSPLEKQLDEMVYKLYELTEEEIKIVEGKK